MILQRKLSYKKKQLLTNKKICRRKSAHKYKTIDFQVISSPIDNVLKPTVGLYYWIYRYTFSYISCFARAEELQDQNPSLSFKDAYSQAIKGTLRTQNVRSNKPVKTLIWVELVKTIY